MEDIIDKQIVWLVIMATITTLGLIEWIKNFVQPPGKVWAVLMPLVGFCMAYIHVIMPQWVSVALLVVASIQLCHDTLLQGIRKIIQALVDKAAQGK